MINTNLNVKSLRQRFSRDDRVRVDNFLQPDVIEEVAEEIEQAPFELVYVLDGNMQTTSKARMDAMSATQKKQINTAIRDQAGYGVGFLYGSCHLGAGRPQNIGPNMTRLFDEFITSPQMIEFVQGVTGDKSVNSVSGHYTRYLPGHFLTRHRDEVQQERRRFAYVLSFTPEWHPDWGGLLQFYEEDGTPRDAWAPKFNSLTIFDVKHIHAVTYVTPFARSPRLSLTGWFMATPFQ
jgi:Rps23 Pro-64 3,4-dihydroxylase Tpa1-like proline 4-hydroxylase